MKDAPKAQWLQRFARETLHLDPTVNPLDAVRRAVAAAKTDIGQLAPEEAARGDLHGPVDSIDPKRGSGWQP